MLKMLLGSPWMWIALVAAVLAVSGVSYIKGRSDGGAICEARWLKREAARITKENEEIAKRDARINQAEEENKRRAEARLSIIETLQTQVEAYEAAQANRPDDDCSITDDDARSLSDIK